jgi:hypothetical protein
MSNATSAASVDEGDDGMTTAVAAPPLASEPGWDAGVGGGPCRPCSD